MSVSFLLEKPIFGQLDRFVDTLKEKANTLLLIPRCRTKSLSITSFLISDAPISQ